MEQVGENAQRELLKAAERGISLRLRNEDLTGKERDELLAQQAALQAEIDRLAAQIRPSSEHPPGQVVGEYTRSATYDPSGRHHPLPRH